MKILKKTKKKNDIRETFCPVCLAIPLAVAGAGAGAGAGAAEKKKKRKIKNILIWTSIILIAISFLFFAIYFDNCKKCK